MVKIRFFSIFLIAVFANVALEAKDLGVFGPTFPIRERSLKQVIESKAGQLSQEALHNKYQSLIDNIKDKGSLFKDVKGVRETERYHSSIFDPSQDLREDIRDEKGKVLFKKGTRVNPLDHVHLDNGLLFLDGTNERHILWAKEQKGEFKWILVKGDPLKIQETQGRPVFFDQGGFYCKHFKIKKVPCRITQSGKSLLLEEVPVRKRGMY